MIRRPAHSGLCARRRPGWLAALALGLSLGALAAVPANAQERGGLRLRGPGATMAQVEANRGCPLSVTAVSTGVNRAFGTGAQASQSLGTANPASGPDGCRPLVSTQIAAGVNLALGRGSQAGQQIETQGPRGALATTAVSRGVNMALGARSSAQQRIVNHVLP